MAIRKYSFAAASIADQTGTAFSPRMSGYIKSIQYIKVDYTDGVDFTITAEATGETIWTELNVNAAATKHPRAGTHNLVGVANLYVAAGTTVNDQIALGNDRIKVVLAQAGATKTGTFVVTIDDPRGKVRMIHRETWYVLEDGLFADPRQVSADDKGVLRHKGGAVVKIGPNGPVSSGVDLEDGKPVRKKAKEVAPIEAKDMKPEEPKREYKTRESKRDDLGILSRLFGIKQKHAEGAYQPGPYFLSGGWLSASAGRFLNWWQLGHSLRPYGESGAMVEACVSAYAQTVAMCPGDHWIGLKNGGRERVTTSALSRIIRRPNDYQSMSDFLLNLTRWLYTKGEVFAVAIRNNRSEVQELHWMRDGYPVVAVDGSIFYSLSGNEVAERRFDLSAPIPGRDVLHVRLQTPRHPLKGESPIVATQLEQQMAGAALTQQVAFYLNQARPSFILETDMKLTATEAADLRQRWESQTQGEHAGGTPILSWGLKAKPVTVGAGDAHLADMLKMTDQNVALAFRVPLQILGIGGTPFASTEALMSLWKGTGLGFALDHIEEAFGLLFGLKGVPDEYLEFNTKVLMRSAFKERIEGLVRGVMGGVYSSDEARAEEDLPATPGGHGKMPRVQQQVVPLSYGTEIKPPQPAPTPSVSDDTEAADDDEPEDDADGNERARQILRTVANAQLGA